MNVFTRELFRRLRASEAGVGLIAVIATSAILLLSGAALMKLVRFELRATVDQKSRTKAFFAAEAGVENALARLERDRTTVSPPSTSGGYAPPAVTGTVTGGGSYSATITSDPAIPGAGRKLITSIGTFNGITSTIESRALVQDPPSVSNDPTRLCPIEFANTGTAELAFGGALATAELFNGEIFSNNHVRFTATLAGLTNASGTVRARGNFISNGLIQAVPGSRLTSATLLRNGVYTSTDAIANSIPVLALLAPAVKVGNNLLCTLDQSQLGSTLNALLGPLSCGLVQPTLNLLGLNLLPGVTACNTTLVMCPGIRFSNPPSGATWGQGTNPSPVIPAATMPVPDYDAIKLDPRTVVVNSTYQPFGSWNSGTNTWVYNGNLVFPTSPDVIYYVEGNAQLRSIHLASDTAAMIVTRGHLAIRDVNLLTVPLSSLTSPITALLPGSASPVTTIVDNASAALSTRGQNLWLVAQNDVVVGQPLPIVSNVVTNLGLASFLGGAGDTGLNLAAAGLTTPIDINIFAYSQTAGVHATTATVAVSNITKMCMMAATDAALSTTVSVGSSIRSLDNPTQPYVFAPKI